MCAAHSQQAHAAWLEYHNLLKMRRTSLGMLLAMSHSNCSKSMKEAHLSMWSVYLQWQLPGDDSSLLKYTRKWTRQVNQGGLFEIGDMYYFLSREIELKTQQHLPSILSQSSSSDSDCNNKEVMISAVLGNESVQFFWTILSVDISNE